MQEQVLLQRYLNSRDDLVKEMKKRYLQKIILTESIIVLFFALLAVVAKISIFKFLPMIFPVCAVILIIYLGILFWNSTSLNRVNKKIAYALEEHSDDLRICPDGFIYEREKEERMNGDSNEVMYSVIFQNNRTKKRITFAINHFEIYHDVLEKRKTYRFVKLKKYLIIIKEE